MQNRADIAYESYRAFALRMGAEPRSREHWASFIGGSFARPRPRRAKLPAVISEPKPKPERIKVPHQKRAKKPAPVIAKRTADDIVAEIIA